MPDLADRIKFETASLANVSIEKRVLVWFVTGNPGLIEYYRTFLRDLHNRLCDAKENVEYIVQGVSLAGFALKSGYLQHAKPKTPLNLQQQIQYVCTELETAVHDCPEDAPVEVVVIGHSVGAYIALQIVEWWQSGYSDGTFGWSISQGILLFPTVVDIAKSPSGRMLTPLLRLPLFALAVHYLVQVSFTLVPSSLINRLVRLVTGMPNDAATVTAAFLQSRIGVYQALFLAKHEMAEIGEDKFSNGLWGLSDSNTSQRIGNEATETIKSRHWPYLHFYWGENDHWVANETRHTLLTTRASAVGSQSVTMEIDTQGVPHGYCIRHSSQIAEKVASQIVKER